MISKICLNNDWVDFDINLLESTQFGKKKKFLYDSKKIPARCEIKFNCIICGVESHFANFDIKNIISFRYICGSCARKEYNLNNYGVENPSQRDDIKEKKKQTQFNNYGTINGFDILSVKKTMMERYGVEHASKSKEIINKAQKTIRNNRNGLHTFQTEEFKDENKKRCYYNLINKKIITDNFIPLFDFKTFSIQSGKYTKYSWQCKKCNNKFDDYYANGKIPRCPICYPHNQPISDLEKEVVDFIKSLNINNIIENDRIILNGKELDIYLPDYKLAIEFNGLYWHSELNGKDRNYHLNKTEECNKQDIQLLHIFEDEWIDKQEIIKNIIKVKLGLIKTKIYARKCVIKELNSNNTKEILNTNHIQGYISAKINIGLYYENELVSLLTFGKPRYNKKYDWEILRFINKGGISIIGGFAKMLKYFLINYKGSIITYSDKRLFDGGIYNNNGFNKLKPSKPSYYYINYKNSKIVGRFNRQSFQKHKLKDKLDIFDSTFTEWENMQMNGWDRIWDCGNHIFELRR